MTSSIFSKIIEREIPAYIIDEDDDFIAFLDIHPLKKGHTLVVIKQQIDCFFTIDDNLLAKYIVFAKKIATKIKLAIPCKRIAMSVVGLEVPHAHIHLIPIDNIGDVNFEKQHLSLSKEEMQTICDKIKHSV